MSCLRDENGQVENFISHITDITALMKANERNRILAEQLQQQTDRIAASETTYRLLAENAGDVVCHLREGRVVWVSPSVEAVLGTPADYWLGRDVLDYVLTEDESTGAALLRELADGGTVEDRIRVVSPDGVTHWLDLHAKPFYDSEGHQDGSTVALRLVDDQVAAAQVAQQAQAKADERYRRSMDIAAVAMCLIAPDGRLHEVNDAACRLFGYDADTLTQKTWQELIPPESWDDDLQNLTDVQQGRTDSFRVTKHYLHPDGHLIWVDLSVSCLRDEAGQVVNAIALITDITEQVQAGERNRLLAQQLQQQTDQMKNELDSAASYP